MAKRKWIAKATRNKGALTRALPKSAKKKGGGIKASALKTKKSDSPTMKRRKNLARTLRKISKRRSRKRTRR